MVERLVSYGGVSVLLDCQTEGLEQFVPPPITGLYMDVEDDPVALVRHRIGESFAIKKDGDHSISVEGPEDMNAAVFFLGELAAESYRQAELGGALVHAAAVADNTGRGNFIFGEKGAGKTTLAVRSCVEGDFFLCGNDQIIVQPNDRGVLSIVEGSKHITIRHSATAADEWLDGIANASWDNRRPHWDTKKMFSPQELGIDCVSGVSELKNVVRLCIDRTQQFSLSEKKTEQDLSSVLFFVEKTSRLIRGTTTPIVTDGGALLGQSPNMDTPDAAHHRIDLIHKIFGSEIGVWNIYAGDSTGAFEEFKRISQYE